jgi:glyoxylase-like metal-dependent hydrolase (beta-lactamase superfamily II)
MHITRAPASITEALLMLGTAPYPVYLFRDGGECLLFEGGVGACGPLLREQMASQGLAPEHVRQIVVTHAHPDHVMAVPAFRQMFPGARVLASAAAAAVLSNEKAVAFFGKIDEALTASLLKAGTIADAHRPQAAAGPTIPIDRVLAEGDAVSVGGARFQVLATPGHSECSLSFHEPRLGILIVSDATGYYLPQPEWWWPNYFTDYGAYLASIRRLAGLGAEVLALSHNAAITGTAAVKAYFEAALAATEAYHRRILEAVKAGRGARDIAEELGREAHARIGLLPVDFFQKNCGLLVKLSTKHEGLVAKA